VKVPSLVIHAFKALCGIKSYSYSPQYKDEIHGRSHLASWHHHT